MVLVLDPRNSSSHACDARYILAGHPARPRQGQYVLVGRNSLYQRGGTSDASRTRQSQVQPSLHDEGRSMDKNPQRDRLTIEKWNRAVASSQCPPSSSSSLLDRRSTMCVKNLDAVFNNSLTSGRDMHKVQVKSIDTRDPTASKRENQSHAASFYHKNHAHGQSFRRKSRSHTQSFSRRKGHGSSFRKVKVTAQTKSHGDSFHRKAPKGHDDSFRRKALMMKGREDSSRSGTKIRSAPELAYDSYRTRNSRTLFQQGLDIMLQASKKHP
jgi:hypothetical protein